MSGEEMAADPESAVGLGLGQAGNRGQLPPCEPLAKGRCHRSQQRLVDFRPLSFVRIQPVLGSIGSLKGIFIPPLPPRAAGPPPLAAATRSPRRRLPQPAAAACCSGARRGVARQGAVWTGG
jgi:hypothetical protein